MNIIKELVDKLNRYSDLYYNGNPAISDYEWDILFDKLKTLEKKTGIILSNSPTQNPGYPVSSKLEKVTHQYPMLSLDKTKSADGLRRFVGNKDALIMLKLDGLTVSCTYEDGVLVRAETRGNGEVGELITDNAKTFCNLPLTIPYKERLIVFGEAIIDYNTFNKINYKLPQSDKYKNPRNLCSGTVRQLDSKICADRNVRFIAWRLVEGSSSNNFIQRLEELRSYGFETVQSNKFDSNKLEESLKTATDIAYKLGLPIDGCVITFTDIRYMESLGATSHHLKGQIAYKYQEDYEETVLKDVEWSMGKTGDLTPVAIFDEVEIEGTSVSRASLHNISICKELQLGMGDEITIYKANAIIPQVRENLTKSNNLIIPSICPVCGGITEIVKDNDTEVLKCKNSSCKGRLLGRLTHFVSKKGMDIDGLSESTLAKFIEFGWVKNLFDIYGSLHTHYTELIDMEGFGERSVEKLDSAIENSKDVELKNFITSLSIPGIGSSQSKELAKKFKTWDAFSEAGFGNYDFSELEGFGNILDNNIHIWFSTMWNEDRIGQLVRNMRFKDEKSSVSVNSDLSGLTFVITGSLNQFSNRDAAKEEIELRNGKVSGSVSAKTDYLVNNDINSNSGKNKKAKELGIPIITEEQLITMLR